MYLTEALFYTLLVDYLFSTMATNKFSHKQHLLMYESSVKIRPLHGPEGRCIRREMSVVGELHMHGYAVTNIRSTKTFQNATT